MEQEIDLREYFYLLKKNWLIITVITLLIALITFVNEIRKPLIYETYALINVGYNEKCLVESLDKTIEAIFSNTSISGLAKSVNISSGQFRNQLKIEKNTDMLKIITSSRFPEKAVKLNKAASEYIISRHNMLLEESKKSFEDLIAEKKSIIKQFETYSKKLKKSKYEADALKLQAYVNNQTEFQLSLIEDTKIYKDSFKASEVFTSAYTPENPVPKNLKRNLSLALIFGFIIGVFGVLLKEFFKNPSKETT